MLTLVVYFCLLSSDNGCEIVAVADKFPTMEMCAELGNKFIVPQ